MWTAWAFSKPKRACVSILLAVCVHVGPVWFILFGPVYGLPNVLEVNLEALNLYRDRVFREMAARRAAAGVTPMQLNVAVAMQPMEAPGKRISKPHSEQEMERIRAVQRFIMGQWKSLIPGQPGSSLVSLSILEDGSIGEFVVHRVSGSEQFQSFLLSFLNTLKSTYANQAGPGERIWIECEFAVSPSKGKP